MDSQGIWLVRTAIGRYTTPAGFINLRAAELVLLSPALLYVCSLKINRKKPGFAFSGTYSFTLRKGINGLTHPLSFTCRS